MTPAQNLQRHPALCREAERLAKEHWGAVRVALENWNRIEPGKWTWDDIDPLERRFNIEAQNHPARWPYKLAEDIVRCFCPPDGLCCDPFVGAGTSAAAALEHGRRFVGGDMGSRQDNEDNRRRGLDPVPWVDVTARVLTERFKQERLF
jgi:hypothetical protein